MSNIRKFDFVRHCEDVPFTTFVDVASLALSQQDTVTVRVSADEMVAYLFDVGERLQFVCEMSVYATPDDCECAECRSRAESAR